VYSENYVISLLSYLCQIIFPYGRLHLHTMIWDVNKSLRCQAIVEMYRTKCVAWETSKCHPYYQQALRLLGANSITRISCFASGFCIIFVQLLYSVFCNFTVGNLMTVVIKLNLHKKSTLMGILFLKKDTIVCFLLWTLLIKQLRIFRMLIYDF